MLKIDRDVLAQLGKEFWLPALVSAFWTAAGQLEAGGLTFSSAVTRASASFFFVSWLTGQMFRVAKQTRTEKSFTSIQLGMESILSDIKTETKRLEEMVTGGESFAYLIFAGIESGRPMILASHQGEAPVYDLDVMVLNLHLFDQIANDASQESISSCETHFKLTNMAPGFASALGHVVNAGSEERDFNVFFTARNGGWIQFYRSRKINGKWVAASLVLKRMIKPEASKVVFAVRDNDFPIDALPKEWPADGDMPPQS